MSSKLFSFSNLRRHQQGSICFQLLSYLSSLTVVHFHFHAHNNNTSIPNLSPNSTPNPHIELQKLLLEKSKSGFHDLNDALLVFDKMLKTEPLPYDFHFNQLLTALVKTKHYNVAVSLFRNMCSLSVPMDVITFNIVINCCCHLDRVDYAFAFLAGIFKRGFVPDVFTYTTIIRGLCCEHKSAEARVLFTNLVKFKEFRPNVVSYSTMINGLCKMGHADMAVWLFRFMEKWGCKPNTVTYSTVIDSLCKRGFVDDALKLHLEMIEKGVLPNGWTYSSIIQVLCNLNRWEEVNQLLKQMIDEMKIYPDAHIFTILVDAYCKSGKLEEAEWMIEIMNEKGECPDIVTYSSLMQAYCSQGQMDGALAVLKTIKSKMMMPNCYTYNILLDAYCRELKLDTAMDLYRNMACEGLVPTNETHNILLHGLCLLGNSMEALTFFYKIQDQGYKLDIVIYRTLLDGLCKNQYVDKALCLFQLMRSNGLIPDRDTHNIIIRGCLRNKKYNEACKLMDKMVDCGFLADAFTKSLLQHLVLSEVQDPTLLAMHQKCLQSGNHDEDRRVHISKVIHGGSQGNHEKNHFLKAVKELRFQKKNWRGLKILDPVSRFQHLLKDVGQTCCLCENDTSSSVIFMPKEDHLFTSIKVEAIIPDMPK